MELRLPLLYFLHVWPDVSKNQAHQYRVSYFLLYVERVYEITQFRADTTS